MRDHKEQVLGALALHNLHSDAPVRARIGVLVGDLIARDRALAAPVARQFRFHGDWSQADALGALLREGRLPSLTDQMTVVHYIGLAGDFGTADRARAAGESE